MADDVKFDLEIDTAYKMESTDWIPLIDAMAYLSHFPQCGDITKNLHDLFVAAQKGSYYCISISWNEEKQCAVIGYAEKMPLPSGREEWKSVARKGNITMKQVIADQWDSFNNRRGISRNPIISAIMSIFKRGKLND